MGDKKMDKIELIAGNDNGNNEHDIIINGELITQPNVFAKVRKLPNLDEVKKEYVIENIEKNLIVTCEDPNGIYYIGDYALNSGQKVRNIEVGNDNNKIESDIVFVNTLAQLAAYGVSNCLKENIDFDELLQIKVDMTTGLPVSYYNVKNSKEFADKFLLKKHFITVHVGTKSVRVEIEFTFVKVIPEGVTTTFAFKEIDDKIFEEYNTKHSDEKLNKNFFNNETKIMHIAIGEGTTEYPITKGVEFDPNFILGTDNGMGYAIDRSLEEFKKAKGLAKLSRQDYSNIIKDSSHKYNELAMEIIDSYIEEEAEEILSNAKKEIQKANNDVDIVCVYGGGSILMRKYIESKLEKFCERAEIKLLYVPKEFAVKLEAQGLYNFTKGEIFKLLKNNYIKNKKDKK
nr:ParM/StbA family protein [Clostridium botulinum]ALP68974.1 putative plasmid segregation protein ParM [Clostridium botulinum]